MLAAAGAGVFGFTKMMDADRVMGDLTRTRAELEKARADLKKAAADVANATKETNTLKIATEIERIADYANNIAKMVQRKFAQEDMSPIESMKPSVDIMAREAVSMLTEALASYEKNDSDLALLVPKRDALVNRLNKDLFRNILAMATVKQYANELAMDFHTAIRYIERVADRSGNIAEYVYYAATGFRFPDNSKK